MEDHISALNDLKSILKIDPNNDQIKKNYEELFVFIESEKKGEKKVFRSFFRKINETGVYKDAIETKKDLEKSNTDILQTDVYIKAQDDDNNIGKPEIRILNL